MNDHGDTEQRAKWLEKAREIGDLEDDARGKPWSVVFDAETDFLTFCAAITADAVQAERARLHRHLLKFPCLSMQNTRQELS